LVLQLTLAENWVEQWTTPFFEWIIRSRVIPPEAYDRFLVSKGDATDVRHALGISNMYGAYTFVFDGQSQARWVASGKATEPELDMLFRVMHALIKEEKRRQQLGGTQAQHTDDLEQQEQLLDQTKAT
jgi:hypothetical protein